MGRQSDSTKLLAIGLLNVADDEGYFYADAKLIRNSIRPFDDNSGITTVSLRDLSKIGYISVRRHATHGDVGKVVAFLDHQVINKPKRSKIKELHESGIDTVSIPDEYSLERKGKEGNGGGEDDPPPPPLDFAKTKTDSPHRRATFDQVLKFGRGQLPPVSDKCCERFFDRMEADGWINDKGFPLNDWRARFRTWAESWADNENSPNRNHK